MRGAVRATIQRRRQAELAHRELAGRPPFPITRRPKAPARSPSCTSTCGCNGPLPRPLSCPSRPSKVRRTRTSSGTASRSRRFSIGLRPWKHARGGDPQSLPLDAQHQLHRPGRRRAVQRRRKDRHVHSRQRPERRHRRVQDLPRAEGGYAGDQRVAQLPGVAGHQGGATPVRPRRELQSSGAAGGGCSPRTRSASEACRTRTPTRRSDYVFTSADHGGVVPGEMAVGRGVSGGCLAGAV
jgi:hypothetical protein